MKTRFILSILLLIFSYTGIVFGQAQKKIAYGVLVDNTGSLRSQLNQVKNVVKVIFQETVRNGPVSVFNFATHGQGNNAIAKVVSGISWSQEQITLGEYTDGLYTVPGKTSLYDAILSISETVNSKANSENDVFSEKVLILVTDGEDRESKTNKKKLIQYLKENKIKVYAVGLVEELDSSTGFTQLSDKTKAEDFLKKITKETGGRVVFSKRKQKIEDAAKDLFVESIKQSN